MTEQELTNLEEQIPLLAQQAFQEAAIRNQNQPLVFAEDGKLVERLPDGTRRIIKTLETGLNVKKGTKISIKEKNEYSSKINGHRINQEFGENRTS